MKVAIYPGSFNPWHEGHSDILKKALKIFDKVIISAGRNPDKATWDHDLSKLHEDFKSEYSIGKIVDEHFVGMLIDHIRYLDRKQPIDAVIRGLRNGSDLQYETNQQYWNEDLGLTIPTIYFICDRRLGHISSSVIRMLRKFNVHEG